MTYLNFENNGLRRAGGTALALVTALLMSTGTTEALTTIEKETMMTPLMIDGPQGQLATYAIGAGDKQPILFLHGDSGRASQWAPVMALLGNDRPTLSFDFRGHGASAPADNSDYSIAGRAEDVGVVVQGLQQFVLVAHSGGAAVALEYANTHAEQVQAILLVEPATDPRGMPKEMRQGFLAALAGPGGVEALKGYYASIAGTNPETIATVQADVEAVHADARLGVAEALLGWNPEVALAGYAGPVAMLVVPTNDTPAALYHLQSSMEHTVLQTPGHWVQLDAPQTVADEVTRFILSLNE